MHGAIKFTIGAGGTALLGWGAHAGLGQGGAFIADLESRATIMLGEAGGYGTTLSIVREPALERTIILSGDADAQTRARLLAAMRAVPGVRDARWADSPGPQR